jgi:hypothetical protein
MNETRKTSGWRTFVFKVAVLWLLWLLLAATFAAQFYWMGKDWPLNISWKESFLHALVEWCPWMVLSPAVIWLAERCRFDRGRRLWGVFPHLPACVLVALAYQGITTFLMRHQTAVFFHNSAGDFGVVKNAADGGGIQGFVSGANLAHEAPFRGRLRDTDSPTAGEPAGAAVSLDPGQGAVSVRIINLRDDIAPGGPSTERVQAFSAPVPFAGNLPPPLPPGLPGPWTRFLHLGIARAQSTIPIYWAIVCVTWVVSYYQQLRERERRTLELEARLSQANLQTLKAQLQPHFLFNTLNAIVSLVRRKPVAAEEMIGALSDFLRMNLDAAQQNEVPLRREMEFLDLYLEIQQTRFGERLRIRKEIDPPALEIAVPANILQPLVENSVRHGIEPREAGGTIWIRARRQVDSLQLDVTDDGEGLKGGHLAAIREGIGLSNTKARLQELYGDGHQFQILPNADGGMTVLVQLPWRAANESLGIHHP